MAAATADKQLPASELEVESEAEPSGETSSVRSQINTQVNSPSGKILLALAASLGVLVLGTGAAPP